MRISYQLSIGKNDIKSQKVSQRDNRTQSGEFMLPNFHTNSVLISFSGMKKNQFDGVDALVVDKFKAPIEKFRTVDYLYDWADNQCDEILEKDYYGRTPETMAQRVAMLDEWKDYFENENKEYSPTEKLLILKGITKELKPDNDNIPPVLNKGVLADTMYNLKEDLKQNPRTNFDFAKTYTNKLREFYLEDTKCEDGETKWIIIPSQKKDPDNFDSNVEKLKTLSHNSWCTKSNNAEPYLSKGDFHIYIENGQPQLGIRFEDNEIVEVQGAHNNSKIPVKYFDEFKAHIDGQGYELGETAKTEIACAEKVKEKLDALKKDLDPILKENDNKKLFEYFGIGVNVLEDGKLELSHFDEPKEITYDDLGINENNLFKNVVRIKGNAKFCRSTMTDLRDLKEIGGNADFDFSKFKTLGGLEKIGGNVELNYVFGLEDLGNVEEIGGDVAINMTKIKEFKKLKRIGGSIDLTKAAELKSLGSVEEVGGDFTLGYSQKDLGKLRRIGGNANFAYKKLDSLGELERIEKNANFDCAEIRTLNKLKYIGGDANFTAAEIDDYGDLTTIKGYIKTDRGMRMDIVRHMVNNGNVGLLLTLNDKSPQYDEDDRESMVSRITRSVIKKFKAEGKWGFKEDE
ncbi:MAG: hypothetical protein K6E29_08130 [Cyanobacteria bacterium RUI128]|nr:hypothetical protein [Cyanobacteria bacterium RUI128]